MRALKGHRAAVTAVALLATLAAGAIGAPAAHAAPTMVFEGETGRIPETAVSLTAGRQVVFATSATSPGADPVLHLLNGAGTEVAVDDSSAGGADALIRYVPPSTGTYTLVLRARTSTTGGQTTITRDGATLGAAAPFGGWRVTLQGVRTGERLFTVLLPNGGGPTHELYVLKANGLGIEARRVGNGGGRQAFYIGFPTASASRDVVVGIAATAGARTGKVRLLRNDVGLSGHDPDADGLGTELESAIGTCSSRSGYARNFDCALATDARDTDGDGIRDDYETLGRMTAPQQFLPAWGADPRHKDMFIEVDYVVRPGDPGPRRFEPALAREFAQIYADKIGTPTGLQRAYHAATLRNPDAKEGINVHLDTGTNPPVGSGDATLYGDWGGYTAIPASMNPNCDSAWRTNMAWSRWGIFRHALGYGDNGGGKNGEGVCSTWGILPDGGGFAGAHETGHALGIQHSGVEDGSGNCKPNYPSVMNYADEYDPLIPFSDGLSNVSLNNWRSLERNVVPTSFTALMDRLEGKFEYWVDRSTGSVDWNRDGVIAPAGVKVKAYTNYKRGGTGCEHTHYNNLRIDDARPTTTLVDPALTRLGTRLYLFYPEGTRLKYRVSSSSWRCPAPAGVGSCVDPATGQNGSWGSERDAGMQVGRGVDAEAVYQGGIYKLLVVTSDGAGRLWQRTLSVSPSGAETWSAGSQIAGSAVAGGVSLAKIDVGQSAYLAYRGIADATVRFRRWWNGTWEAEQTARGASGAPVVLGAATTPAIAQVYVPNHPKGLYGAFAATDGGLDIWSFNLSTSRWDKLGDVLEERPMITGRPAMAWVPSGTSGELPGRLYLVFRRAGSADTTVDWMTSFVKVTRGHHGTLTRRSLVGMRGPWSNEWNGVYGLDISYTPGVDSNLRMTEIWGGDNGDTPLIFYPKADGIQDAVSRNFNDWARLRLGLCRDVMTSAMGLSNPIRCP